MNALVGSLLAALVVASVARPRWWLSFGPVVVAIALTGYRLATSRGASSEEAIALVGIVLLAAAMEAALLAGALLRAVVERLQGRPESARAAARAGRGIALVGLGFLGTIWLVARAPSGVFVVLALGAAGVVLARAWRARLRGAALKARRTRPAPRRVQTDRRRASATTRPTIIPTDRRRARLRRGPARPSARRRVSP
jgi:hypothetical protein